MVGRGRGGGGGGGLGGGGPGEDLLHELGQEDGESVLGERVQLRLPGRVRAGTGVGGGWKGPGTRGRAWWCP